MEGRKFFRIHNLTIWYFQKILDHTFFGRGDSSGSVNFKELYFIDYVFHYHRIHTTTYMLAKIQDITNVSTDKIVIGCLITTIALCLGLDVEVATLEPI